MPLVFNYDMYIIKIFLVASFEYNVNNQRDKTILNYYCGTKDYKYDKDCHLYGKLLGTCLHGKNA